MEKLLGLHLLFPNIFFWKKIRRIEHEQSASASTTKWNRIIEGNPIPWEAPKGSTGLDRAARRLIIREELG